MSNERLNMRRTLYGAILSASLAACGDEGSEPVVPYSLGQALVIGDDEGEHVADVDSCEEEDRGACEAVLERCGDDAYADVVLDEGGEVADVLCYRGNVHVEEIGEEAVETADAGNNTVLVLDDLDDGADVTGAVVLSGNNTIVYGQGADVSVIGSLAIEKNNAIVRAVTIQGDVTIDKNNAQLSFVVIEGNLTINANNATLASSTVLGTVSILGNNAVFVDNQISGVDALAGKNLTCNDNHRSDDADADGEIEELEIGAEITCSSD